MLVIFVFSKTADILKGGLSHKLFLGDRHF